MRIIDHGLVSNSSNVANLARGEGKIQETRTNSDIPIIETCSSLRSSFMIKLNVVSAATNTLSTSDSNSRSPFSCPSIVSSLSPPSITPDIMARDQSNDEARSREPVAELPAQEYVVPNDQDGLKLESDVSKQRFSGDEPPSEPPAQEHLVSESQEGLKLEFDVSNESGRGDKPPSQPPADKNLDSKSQEGQDASVVAAVQRAIDHDDDQTVVSFPLSTTFRPVNMVMEERSYSLQPNGLAQESGEQRPTAGRPESQQPQLGNLNKSYGNSWQANDVSQTRDAAARNSSSVSDQRRAESEATQPKNDLSVGQPVLDQGSRNNGPRTTFDTRSHEGSVLSSMQTTQIRAKSEVNHQQDISEPVKPSWTKLLLTMLQAPPLIHNLVNEKPSIRHR